MLMLPPKHIEALAGVNTIVGVGLTDKVTAAVEVHPKTLVPVTVQPVVTVGDTTIVFVVAPPGVHKQVDPPPPVNIALPPGQIEVGLAIAVTTGSGFTVTDTVVDPEHPAVVPVTVYTDVPTVIGVTDIEAVIADVLHKQDVEPLADNVDAAPKQIAVGVAVAVIVGLGTTVIVL